MAIQPIHNDEYDETQRELIVPTDWLDQTCSTLGCTVVIRSRAGKQPSVPVCKWCEQNQAYYRTTESPQRHRSGPEISLAEFGVDLYEAIKLKAEVETARKRAGLMLAKWKSREAHDAEQAVTSKEAELSTILDSGRIKPDDVRRILAIQ